jgi:mono/diheme cytochrome c family protein
MNELTDLLLNRPLGDMTARWLMFFLFYTHLLLILILIGTAVIGVHHFLHSYWTKKNFEHRWDKKVLKKFIIPKALGVALGTLVLLVVQLYYAVPFYTSIAIFAPFWLAVIVMMIFGFLMIDGTSHKMDVHPIASLIFGVLGLLQILAVPAVFVLVLITVENSDQWIGMARRGFVLNGELTLHWLSRYLHVIGASLVFGAAFHYVMTAEHHEYRQRILVRWFIIGLILQVVSGGALTLTLQDWIDLWALVPLVLGIAAAGVLVWILYFRGATGQVPHLGLASMVLLPFLLGGMLLTRQYIQQQKVLPLLQRLEVNAEQYRARLEDLRMQQVAAYEQELQVVRDDGATIFARSCAFCHGRTGMGDGQERGNVRVPPERLAQIRANPEYIRTRLREGVPGTAMPYFTIYEENRFNMIHNYLGEAFGIYRSPDDVPVALSGQILFEGKTFYYRNCVLCHGMEGAGGDYTRELSPQPPDLRAFSPQPVRAMEVITQGYRGTAMPSFAHLPIEVRWALVEQVLSLRR